MIIGLEIFLIFAFALTYGKRLNELLVADYTYLNKETEMRSALAGK